jgi:hypothetical protein
MASLWRRLSVRASRGLERRERHEHGEYGVTLVLRSVALGRFRRPRRGRKTGRHDADKYQQT